MKVILPLIILFSYSFTHNLFAQGPGLSLVGGGISFAKGNINTEVLSKVIQQKQEEVKRVVFRNTIIKEFNNSSSTSHLKNYTTYSFLYNLMDVITSGKNKTVITKSIIQNASDFAYVYGLVLYIQASYKAQGRGGSSTNNYLMNATVTADAKAKVTVNGDQQTIKISDRIKDFNLLIDLVYDILMNDKTLHNGYTFSEDFLTNFDKWYESDNVYINAYDGASDTEKANFDNLRIELIGRIKEFTNLFNQFKSLEDLATLGNVNVKTFLDSYKEMDKDAFNAAIQTLVNASAVSSADASTLLNKLNISFDNILPLVEFYQGLKKSDFKDFSLTKDQYYALKYIVIDFLKLAKNQFNNDVVSTVINFTLENTIVEYVDGSTTLQKTEKTATNKDNGYLYVDIEALISAVYQKFSPSDKKGKYIQLFFSIGMNQASFLNDNTLTKNDLGTPTTLKNLYYASEKIGIKYKIWNWRYTHAFSPGQNFNYYTSTQRSWLRPQPKPAISDIYLSVYGSGLLYNLVNLKTSETFNYAIVGSSLGLTFFNGLSLNIGLACPYTDKRFKSENMFLNFGIDVPIIDYISALTK